MSTLKSHIANSMLPILVTFFALVQGAPAEPAEADAASEAFSLRMEAEYDEAMQVLDQELEKNPNNGRAWFELARLRFHTALKM